MTPPRDAGVVSSVLPLDHPRVSAVVGELERSVEYWQVRRAIKEELIKPSHRLDHDFEGHARRTMEAMGLASRLRNFAFAARERLPPDDAAAASVAGADARSKVGTSDPGVSSSATDEDSDPREAAGTLESIAVARRAWKCEMIDRLQRISHRSGVPLADSERRRPDNDPGGSIRRGRRSAPTSSEHDDPLAMLAPTAGPAFAASVSVALERMEFTETLPLDLGHAHDDGDILAAVAAIGDDTLDPSPCPCVVPSWNVVRCELRPPSPAQLSEFFAPMSPELGQVGVDDVIDEAFGDARRRDAETLARGRSIPRCRAFARGGVPAAPRPALWAAALGAPVTGDRRSRATFERLCAETERRRLLVDALVAGDVAETCDHPHYFPFEESMRAVLLGFTRDASVAEERRTHPRVEARSGDGRSLGSYPPCGVVPFRGMARLVAPLCYLYPHPADAYAVFRALYTRHFWRLREIGEETFPNPMLPGLCRAFEDMIHRAEPEVCFRLLRVGCPALTLAAPWMLGGFATHLEVEQVLLLWDRVIGFDSVLPLSVAAAAVVAFRRDALLAATTAEEVRETMEDLSQIQIVPLMQEFLFRGAPRRGDEQSQTRATREL